MKTERKQWRQKATGPPLELNWKPVGSQDPPIEYVLNCHWFSLHLSAIELRKDAKRQRAQRRAKLAGASESNWEYSVATPISRWVDYVGAGVFQVVSR
ncbi:MAG TPA: hypothetical protein VH370_13730, partial [Humisphaera sp.]|nr:hypothetical protein [Humisphaera sp.]